VEKKIQALKTQLRSKDVWCPGWLKQRCWCRADVEKKIQALETQFRREHRKLFLSRQMFAVRYEILNWLISGMSGHEAVCADPLPTVPKHSQQTVCNHRLSKISAGVGKPL
jgi:hypothetical protein